MFPVNILEKVYTPGTFDFFHPNSQETRVQGDPIDQHKACESAYFFEKISNPSEGAFTEARLVIGMTGKLSWLKGSSFIPG